MNHRASWGSHDAEENDVTPTKTQKEIEQIQDGYICVHYNEQDVVDLLHERGIEPEFMHDSKEPPF